MQAENQVYYIVLRPLRKRTYYETVVAASAGPC